MRFENQTFTNTDVTLDWNHFENCTFKDCRIICFGGNFSIGAGCKFANIKYGVGGPGEVVLAFLRMVRDSDPKLLDELLNANPGPSTVVLPDGKPN
jgi:hypothetical protein